MQLSELYLNRYLYRDNNQDSNTKDSTFLSADSSEADPTPIPSGGAAQDINTGNVEVDGGAIEPGTIPPTTLDVSNWGWTQACVFSSTDADTVTWTGPANFVSANGMTYSIAGGNTGNMTDKTYIYLDLNVSEVAYQTSTTSSDAVGAGKVLVAVAKNESDAATYNLVEAEQIVSDNILVNSIDASKITAGTVAVDVYLSVGSGDAIFKADTNGIYLGDATFADAPFSVDMDGNLISQSATIAGYKLFEAVVAPSGGDYTSVSAALTAGATRIFVRNGTYTGEASWDIDTDDTIITGESYGGVDITFSGATSPLIDISSEYCVLEKLKLTTANVDTDFIKFATGAKYPILRNLVLSSGGTTFAGDFIDGSNINPLYGVFSDIYFDYTSKSSGNYLTDMEDCNFYNCIFYHANNGSPTVLTDLNECFFYGCRFIVPDANTGLMVHSNTDGSNFIGCFFRLKEISTDANYYNCIFESNTQADASGWFVSLTGGNTQFFNNRVSCKANTDDIRIFISTGAHQNIQGNYFNYGGWIDINDGGLTLVGGIFSNNVWRGYATATATAGYDVDLTIDTNCDNWNVNGNVLRNTQAAGATPSITDSGTGNNALNNQLILG